MADSEQTSKERANKQYPITKNQCPSADSTPDHWKLDIEYWIFKNRRIANFACYYSAFDVGRSMFDVHFFRFIRVRSILSAHLIQGRHDNLIQKNLETTEIGTVILTNDLKASC